MSFKPKKQLQTLNVCFPIIYNMPVNEKVDFCCHFSKMGLKWPSSLKKAQAFNFPMIYNMS